VHCTGFLGGRVSDGGGRGERRRRLPCHNRLPLTALRSGGGGGGDGASSADRGYTELQPFAVISTATRSAGIHGYTPRAASRTTARAFSRSRRLLHSFDQRISSAKISSSIIASHDFVCGAQPRAPVISERSPARTIGSN